MIFSLIEEKYYFQKVALSKILMEYLLVVGGFIPLIIFSIIYIWFPKVNEKIMNEVTNQSKLIGITGISIASACFISMWYQSHLWLTLAILLAFYVASTAYYIVSKDQPQHYKFTELQYQYQQLTPC